MLSERKRDAKGAREKSRLQLHKNKRVFSSNCHFNLYTHTHTHLYTYCNVCSVLDFPSYAAAAQRRTTFLFAFSSLSGISFLFFYAFLRPLAFSVVLPICFSHFTSSNYRLLYGLIPPRFPPLCSPSCSHSFANPPAHFCRVLFNF